MAKSINLSGKYSDPKGLVLTLGNFDGFHRGHHELVNKIKGLGNKTGVMTFDPHPGQVFASATEFKKISTLKRFEEKLKEFGIDFLIIESFTLALAHMPAREFFIKKIWQPFKPTCLVVGFDFRFGKNREGDMKLLHELSKELGFKLVQVDEFTIDGERVSSSLIRQALLDDDLVKANTLMGDYYAVSGEVIKGEGRGQQIGFRTLNLKPDIEPLIAKGVYITWVRVNNKKIPSVTNVGVKPTFHSEFDLQIESHLIGRTITLYGHRIEVEFIKKLREEKKFSNIQELIQQIRSDVETATKFFEGGNEVGGNSLL